MSSTLLQSYSSYRVENNLRSTSLGEGELRLFGSSTMDIGRLEIFLQGDWGTVCGDGFREVDANVACRQLGFSRASRYGSANLLG